MFIGEIMAKLLSPNHAFVEVKKMPKKSEMKIFYHISIPFIRQKMTMIAKQGNNAN